MDIKLFNAPAGTIRIEYFTDLEERGKTMWNINVPNLWQARGSQDGTTATYFDNMQQAHGALAMLYVTMEGLDWHLAEKAATTAWEECEQEFMDEIPDDVFERLESYESGVVGDIAARDSF